MVVTEHQCVIPAREKDTTIVDVIITIITIIAMKQDLFRFLMKKEIADVITKSKTSVNLIHRGFVILNEILLLPSNHCIIRRLLNQDMRRSLSCHTVLNQGMRFRYSVILHPIRLLHHRLE